MNRTTHLSPEHPPPTTGQLEPMLYCETCKDSYAPDYWCSCWDSGCVDCGARDFDECTCEPGASWGLRMTMGTLREWPANREVTTVKLNNRAKEALA